MSKGLWETIQGREGLEDFACIDTTSHCWEGCDGFMDCETGAAHREYLALRAVVEAELDGATPEAKAASNRRLADAADRTQQAAPGPYTIKAEAWEGLT